MERKVRYSAGERWSLIGLAVVGLMGINGAFLYGMLEPEVMREAYGNPIALAFMAEAFLLMAAFAYLLHKWGVSRVSWRWFVALSLVGSMAFALPIALLWPSRTRAAGRRRLRR